METPETHTHGSDPIEPASPPSRDSGAGPAGSPGGPATTRFLPTSGDAVDAGAIDPMRHNPPAIKAGPEGARIDMEPGAEIRFDPTDVPRTRAGNPATHRVVSHGLETFIADVEYHESKYPLYAHDYAVYNGEPTPGAWRLDDVERLERVADGVPLIDGGILTPAGLMELGLPTPELSPESHEGSTSAESSSEGSPARHTATDFRAELDVAAPDRPEEARRIAQAFHEAYELLAPTFNYQTRDASAKPWADVPDDNKRLMVATVQRLLERGVIDARPAQTYSPESLPEQVYSEESLLEVTLTVRRPK